MTKAIISIFAVSLMAVSCGGPAPEEVPATPREREVVPEEETPEPPVALATVEMNIDTVFGGANVFIRNPYSSTGVGWCVKGVSINGNAVEMSVDTDSLEVDLVGSGVVVGDAVVVTVRHEEGCLPGVIVY